MSERPVNTDLELLAAAAAGDLTDAEQAVVDAMLASAPQARAELEALELAAGAAAAATTSTSSTGDAEAMPAGLRRQILQARRMHVGPDSSAGNSAATPAGPGRGLSAMAWLGWLAAAACLALAAVAWFAGPPGAGPGGAETPSLAEQRRQLLAEASDAVQLDWQDWSLEGEPPVVEGVRGDVVWSESRQEGYLRFVGLPPNDPSERQYQLWIIDQRGLFDEAGQSARISGAVFDADEGELIVPIDPAIPVQDAGAFAVTIEPPGGVWASDMSRRVVIAAKG